MTFFAEVVLALPLDKSFFYAIPRGFESRVKKGARVVVPFKDRLMTGIVVGRKRTVPADLELKEIHSVLDEKPLFRPDFLSFTRQLSGFFYSYWGELLQVALPASFAPRSKTRVSITDDGLEAVDDPALSESDKRLLCFVAQKSYSSTYLKRKMNSRNISPALSRLEKKGYVKIERGLPPSPLRRNAYMPPDTAQLEMDFTLDKESFSAAELLSGKLREGGFSPNYLLGPAKKREAVYFYLIKKAAAAGKKVLFLVPEIGLTQNFRKELHKRLGEKASILHSQISDRQRENQWSRIKAGHVGIIAGPRSALFAPVSSLGLVIVDREEDGSYLQKESPSYDARKGAYLRARMDKAVLIYGSQVPSAEYFYESKKRNNLIALKNDPTEFSTEIIDVRSEKRVIPRKLESYVQSSLARKESVLIFCNRRGYAAYVACSGCGSIPRCRHCDIAMSYHKREDTLVCHYCGYSQSRPEECPGCGSRLIRKKGIGIEAVEEEIRHLFPRSRIVCFDTDFLVKKKDRRRILQRFREGNIDILIGTQLLAHQQELQPASLAALLYPENLLTLSDYRAGQKAFQFIEQMKNFVISDSGSRCVVQTAHPGHYAIESGAKGCYEDFYDEEIRFRRLLNYPPFTHMVEIFFQGENLRTLAKKTREFSSYVRKRAGEIEILGPSLAAVSRLRGQYRVQVILKSKNRKNMDAALRPALKRIKVRKSVLVHY